MIKIAQEDIEVKDYAYQYPGRPTALPRRYVLATEDLKIKLK